MKLHQIIGGEKKSLLSKAYNIGIGVSLGNKWFSVQNILRLTQWGLKYSREDVVIYVADSIHAINIEVRNRIPYPKALSIANNMGINLLNQVEQEAKIFFSNDDIAKIRFARWTDVVDDSFQKNQSYLYSLYSNNKEFKSRIHLIVQEHLKNSQRHFNNADIDRLGMYIIEEMPEVINQVKISGKVYEAYAYPYSGALTSFIKNIQLGKEFPEIRDNIMTTNPKIFLEVR